MRSFSQLFFVLFFFPILLAAKPVNDDFDSFEELLKEGKRQYNTLLAYNELNKKIGKQEHNWYIFSLKEEEDWFRYRNDLDNGSWIKDESGSGDNAIPSATLSALNAAINSFNTTNTLDVELYICLTGNLVLELPSNLTVDLEEFDSRIQPIYDYLEDQEGENYELALENLSNQFTDVYNNKLKALLGQIISSPESDEYFSIPVNGNRIVGGINLFKVAYRKRGRGITELGEYYYMAMMRPEENDEENTSTYWGGCREPFEKYFGIVQRHSPEYAYEENYLVRGGSHIINTVQLFVDGGLCYSNEVCRELIEPGGEFYGHPYISSGTPLAAAINDNPCILLTLQKFNVYDLEGSEFMEQLGNTIFWMLAPILAIPALPELLPLIIEEIVRQSAVNCAAGAAIDVAFQIAFSMLFEDDTFTEARDKVNYVSAGGACLESMIDFGNPYAQALIGGALQCIVNGLSYNEDTGESYDEVNQSSFNNEACLKGAMFGILTQTILNRSSWLFKKLKKKVSTDKLIQVFVDKLGIAPNNVFEIVKYIKGTPSSSADIADLLKVPSGAADNVMEDILNNQSLWADLFESGLFVNLRNLGSGQDVISACRMFTDGADGAAILRIFKNRADDIGSVFSKVRTYLDDTDLFADIGKKKAFFDDLDANYSSLSVEFSTKPRLVRAWEAIFDLSNLRVNQTKLRAVDDFVLNKNIDYSLIKTEINNLSSHKEDLIRGFEVSNGTSPFPQITNKLPPDSDGTFFGSFVNGQFVPTGDANVAGIWDYIVKTDGEIIVGRKHSWLANGENVLAAGEVKFNNGILADINNLSGHYQPTPGEGMNFLRAFKLQGVNTDDVFLSMYKADGTIFKQVHPNANARDLYE